MRVTPKTRSKIAIILFVLRCCPSTFSDASYVQTTHTHTQKNRVHILLLSQNIIVFFNSIVQLLFDHCQGTGSNRNKYIQLD